MGQPATIIHVMPLVDWEVIVVPHIIVTIFTMSVSPNVKQLWIVIMDINVQVVSIREGSS